MLNPTDAARTILESVAPLPVTEVPLEDSVGYVLAADVTSPIDLPAWDNSAMDGYAVRGADVRDCCPVTLRVAQYVPAGNFPATELRAGECARVFTGAPVPRGADTVIRQEDTTPIDLETVRIELDRDVGKNIRSRGEDIQRGSHVLASGVEVGPAQVGVLASIAQSIVPVHRRPRVGILASGNEIADLDERDAILNGRKVASSNSYTMTALAIKAGATPVQLGIARDDPQDLRNKLAGANDADLIVSSGGVSVGEHDHLRSVMEDLGAEIKFWRVRMRPGAPVAFGILDNVVWLGLPGNPVSTMVTFELFVRPAIRRMMGFTRVFRRAKPVIVGETIELQAPRRHFFRVKISESDGRQVANVTGAQGSGILTSMAQADALLIVPEDRPRVHPGESLNAIFLEEPVHTSEVPF